VKESEDAIWTLSWIGGIACDSVGWRVCVLPRRWILDSLVADFCRNFFDRTFVYG
jgi:hypothetical protein